jgi:hypothetical protein
LILLLLVLLLVLEIVEKTEERGRGRDIQSSHPVTAQAHSTFVGSGVPGQAPFIVTDTATDSPGTNLETRIVTFTAEVGGTPPIFRQWKVDKGGGFVAVAASATNTVLIISNAHVADTGRYALFATNAVGGTSTTPVPLVVIEGVD